MNAKLLDHEKYDFVLTYHGQCPFNVGDEVPNQTKDSNGTCFWAVRKMYVEGITAQAVSGEENTYNVGVTISD